MMFLVLLGFLALAIGALIPVQAAANATLSRSLYGTVVWPALALFAVAAASVLLVAVAKRSAPPSLATFRSVPLWAYVGGPIVATYVLSITFLVPRLGVGTAIALVVTGQILSAIAIDKFGLLRMPAIPITPLRTVGAALMVIGLALAVRR